VKQDNVEIIVPPPISRSIDLDVQRLMACDRFHRFDSQTLEDTTAIWEEYVWRLPQASHLTSTAMQKILAATRRGYLGRLDEILRNAARRALQSGQSRIEATLLSQVALAYK
jgi:DNA transposition AAA+ family ATPase